MKFVSYLSLLPLLVSSALGQTGGYLNSCSGISVIDSSEGPLLFANQCNSCNPGEPPIQSVTLPLNYCLENSGGNLTPAYNGYFSLSCNDCFYISDRFTCNCLTGQGDKILVPSIFLNNYISYGCSNGQGSLGCYYPWL